MQDLVVGVVLLVEAVVANTLTVPGAAIAPGVTTAVGNTMSD